MTIDQMRIQFWADPFQTLVVRISNGEDFRITKSERAIISPNGLTMIAFDEDERFHLVDMRYTTIELESDLDAPTILDPSND